MLYPASLFTVMSLSHNGLRVWDRLYLRSLLRLLTTSLSSLQQ